MNNVSGGAGPRGGNGRNGDGTWPQTDGKGCPTCGALLGGGHGGGCPNSALVYDETGPIGRTAVWREIVQLDAAVDKMRKATES